MKKFILFYLTATSLGFCFLAPIYAQQTCNFAGTFNHEILGNVVVNNSDTLFLCGNDTLKLTHNQDFILDGDPVPATAPGIGYVLYRCPSMVSGPTLESILSDDCIWPNSPNDLWLFKDQPNGNALFINDGYYVNNPDFYGVVSTFSKPLLTYLHPITIDNFETGTFESTAPGQDPGPCVNVNPAASKKVVLLQSLKHLIFEQTDSCVRNFRIEGGFPAWDQNDRYEVEVYLQSDPTIRPFLSSNPANFFNGFQTNIYATTPGIYEINVKDKKSCPYSFTMNMKGCVPDNNVSLTLNDQVAAVGSIIKVPVTVKNFDLAIMQFSLKWDPTQLQYLSIKDIHPTLSNFFNPANDVNITQADHGLLSLILYKIIGGGFIIQVPDNDTLFSFEYKVLDMKDACLSVDFYTKPTEILAESIQAKYLGLTLANAEICPENVSVQSPALTPVSLFPNPVYAGHAVRVDNLHTSAVVTLSQNGQHVCTINTDASGTFQLPENIPAGVYIAQIRADTMHTVTKLAVIR